MTSSDDPIEQAMIEAVKITAACLLNVIEEEISDVVAGRPKWLASMAITTVYTELALALVARAEELEADAREEEIVQ